MEAPKKKKAFKPHVIKGLVKQVMSGDYLILSKKPKSGRTSEHHVYLANISAPKLANKDRDDEPFAWYAKEFLRSRLIGEKVEFHVEYQINERNCGFCLHKGTNMNIEIAKTGLVKLNEPRSDVMSMSTHYKAIKDAVADAKKKRSGIFKDDNEYHQKHKRTVIFSTDPEFDSEDYLTIAKDVGKPFKSFVEYVFSPTAVNLYIETLGIVARVNISHIYIPNSEEKICAEAKELLEKRLLGRIVGCELLKVDNYGNLTGRLHNKNGDIDVEFVKRGLAKIILPEKDEDFDAIHFKDLLDAQDEAQEKKLGLWNEGDDEESKSKNKNKNYSANAKEFDAKVIEVYSGDSISVLLDNGKARRLFLASVKAPKFSRRDDEDHEPWAWEAKEFVRKTCIGKTVHVEMEFKREINVKGEDYKEETKLMEFASVFVGKKNIAAAVVGRGFAKTSLSKFKEDNSKYFDDLNKAAETAESKKIGIYSIKEANIYRYIDTSKNLKAARTLFDNLSSKGDMIGTIEYVFSGSKFKIRLDADNIIVAFGLIGIECPQPDPNQPEITAIHDKAKDNAKNRMHQHDVIINVKHMDKKGNFMGNLWHYDMDQKKRGKNYIREIIRNGQGAIQADKNHTKIDEYKDIALAQEDAKHDEIGVWKPSLAVVYGVPGDVEEEEESLVGEVHTGRIIDIQDASSFYVAFSKDDDRLFQIEKTLKDYSKPKYTKLVHPVKPGTICAAKFEVDGNWYRATVDRQLHHKKSGHFYEVTFLDYGNKSEVAVSSLKKIDPVLMKIPPLAHHCTLAYIKVARVSHTFGKAAFEYFKEKLWGKNVTISVVDEDDYAYSVVVNAGKIERPDDTIQAFLIQEGIASILESDLLPEKYEAWKEFEHEAKEEQLNIWEIDGGNIA